LIQEKKHNLSNLLKLSNHTFILFGVRTSNNTGKAQTVEFGKTFQIRPALRKVPLKELPFPPYRPPHSFLVMVFSNERVPLPELEKLEKPQVGLGF